MRQLLTEPHQRLLEGFAVIVVAPTEHCLGVPNLEEDALSRGKAVLRAARVIAVIADVGAALTVKLAAARVLLNFGVAAAALGAGVGLKNFVVVEALAVVLVEPPRLAPPAAEAATLR